MVPWKEGSGILSPHWCLANGRDHWEPGCSGAPAFCIQGPLVPR